ncbi:ferric reductase-like transmembrane domain-containing protein [Moellerella wisconsensis]|uniref:Ferric reductase-like transmembrane domain-containing protein n=1 Tax=Moellerella wisconsensis TaxID=158849 RepID=A0ACD3YAP6_9GAMM|nr:ferric reductase-like transmembrane domain-containing protein [Moellerella wisconsensis]KLN96959.1 sulfite oxidase subunit YedZ [Moellerella wisconsensis]UNH25445.1 ferric reductase-like transmembrane domain-containing protein [Moellerella wisconsensis]UNH28630.1 ferric reductase-like transmembrane domain-containing protein [Moellerella wisconsensis]UNH40237.1 ferric reductase-like transmembrane domain-containing protein [Moellerella wisconsensis]UNH43774.1 ferric reductase-like transmembra
MPQKNRWLIWLTKGIGHLIALLPLLELIFLIRMDQLGADPAKDIQHFTGISALRILILIALIPLLARLFQFTALFEVRKLLGLWCFVWAILHLSSYLVLEIGINDLSLFFAEVFSRVYLILGAIGWLCLLVMAISSLDPIKNRLGLWWKKIHLLLYPTLLLVLCHFILSLKTLTPEPFIYLALISCSLIYRRWSIKR